MASEVAGLKGKFVPSLGFKSGLPENLKIEMIFLWQTYALVDFKPGAAPGYHRVILRIMAFEA
jgi:hypothetical protein